MASAEDLASPLPHLPRFDPARLRRRHASVRFHARLRAGLAGAHPRSDRDHGEACRSCPAPPSTEAGEIDILFVPGGGDAVAPVMRDSTYIDFIRHVGGRARLAGLGVHRRLPARRRRPARRPRSDHLLVPAREPRALPDVRVSAGYPRWVQHGNRFSGGGISSSIDLALELVNQLSGPTQARPPSSPVQYAPRRHTGPGTPARRRRRSRRSCARRTRSSSIRSGRRCWRWWRAAERAPRSTRFECNLGVGYRDRLRDRVGDPVIPVT